MLRTWLQIRSRPPVWLVVPSVLLCLVSCGHEASSVDTRDQREDAKGAPWPCGLWITRPVSRGGIGSIIRLRPKGHAERQFCVIVDARYGVEGDRLVFSPPGSSEPGEQGVFFRIEGDTLMRGEQDDPSPATRLSTRGGAGARGPGIVGVWKIAYYPQTLGPSYERFTADGSYAFRAPMGGSPRSGRWELTDGVLRITWDHGRTADYAADERSRERMDLVGHECAFLEGLGAETWFPVR